LIWDTTRIPSSKQGVIHGHSHQGKLQDYLFGYRNWTKHQSKNSQNFLKGIDYIKMKKKKNHYLITIMLLPFLSSDNTKEDI